MFTRRGQLAEVPTPWFGLAHGTKVRGVYRERAKTIFKLTLHPLPYFGDIACVVRGSPSRPIGVSAYPTSCETWKLPSPETTMPIDDHSFMG